MNTALAVMQLGKEYFEREVPFFNVSVILALYHVYIFSLSSKYALFLFYNSVSHHFMSDLFKQVCISRVIIMH